ncbi:MAG: SRPBCC family protein [Chloroflexi bacterium]|nr:SRPBCC family protein [Chloroflexota bacterium]
MSLHRLEAVQVLPVGRDEAWEFFSNPRNLSVITPPDMGFEITEEIPERVHPGLIVVYKVRPLLGIPVTWVTEITAVVEGELFVDDQRIGPYRFWHHQHHFRDAPGGTEARDIVHYALPFGPLGGVVNERVIAPRLQSIFDFRRGVIEQRFGLASQPR